jgi:hypothetical protein
MDDKVRETIVTSFSRLVFQKCDDRLVDCTIEHKVRVRSCRSGASLSMSDGLVLVSSSALGAGDALRPGADLGAEARGAVDRGRRRDDAGADERRGARRDGDGEAGQDGHAVRAVPRRRQPLAGGVRGGRRRLGRGPRAGQLPGAERDGGSRARAGAERGGGGGVIDDNDSLVGVMYHRSNCT